MATLGDIYMVRYPGKDPNWDPYWDQDKAALQGYQDLIVKAIEAAGNHLTNMPKPSLVLQNPDESPEAFYTRLLDAYRMYIPVNPEAPKNAGMIMMAFISQSALDIQKSCRSKKELWGFP